jgi:hypothetical protein
VIRVRASVVRAFGVLRRHPRVLFFTLLALAVRLVWNLAVHPPLAYAFSDMGGYLERAQTSIDFPDEPRGYFALFPWGTHALLALVKRVFGRDASTSIGVTYALLGALAAGYVVATAERLTRSARLTILVGIAIAGYYPWISFGGYALSEPPFTLFLCATAYHGLAYADRGRRRDAWLFGAALAIGATFRPQILAALPLYALLRLLRRGTWRRARIALPERLAAVTVPLAVVLAVSAWRVHFHTGRYGFIANNGPLNYAFGRCHATGINAVAPDRRSGYVPPPLAALAARDAETPQPFFRLDPARETTITVTGHIWEREPFDALAADCVRRTGLARQARYAITHVALLWFFNAAWPDAGQPRFRAAMTRAQDLHNALVLPGAIVGLALAFTRRRARWMLLGLHVFALAGVAMAYFGDTRLRAPYDGLLVILAVCGYATVARWAKHRIARRSSPRTIEATQARATAA